MVRRILALTALVVTFVAMSAGSAFSAGQINTIGNCISDGWYGNEPNMADGSPGGPSEQEPGTKGGNVVPTESPGPWTFDYDPENLTFGLSVGQYKHQFGISIPRFCGSQF